MKKASDKRIISCAKSFRKGLLNGAPSLGMCAAVCWPLTTLLQAHGVDCKAVESDLGHMNHFWIRLADGRALDPTADQFNGMGFSDVPAMPEIYLGEPLVIHRNTVEGK